MPQEIDYFEHDDDPNCVCIKVIVHHAALESVRKLHVHLPIFNDEGVCRG